MDSIVLVVVLTVAVATDLKFNKIFNGLSLFALVAGIVLHLQAGPVSSALIISLGGAVISLLLFLPFYMFGGMAAGDVKLMAACSAIIGLPYSLFAVGLTLMFGTVMGVAVYCIRGGASEFASRYWYSAKLFISTARLYVPEAGADSIAKQRFPYAAAIAGGCLVAHFIAITQVSGVS